MKLCIDCKYHKVMINSYICMRPDHISTVTGRVVCPQQYCETERDSGSGKSFLFMRPAFCGKAGYYWEKKNEVL